MPTILPRLAGPRGYPLLVGVALLTYVYSHLAPTRAHGHSVWGLCLVNFLFFTGAGAGAIGVGAVLYGLGSKRFRPAARTAELLAIGCLALAAFFVVLDLIPPGPAWDRLRGAGSASSLVWDVLGIWIYLGNVVGLAYAATKMDLLRTVMAVPAADRLAYLPTAAQAALAAAKTPSDRRVLRQLVTISLPTALLLDAIPAWILRHLEAGPDRLAALIAALLIVSTPIVSAVLALALLMLVAGFGEMFLGPPGRGDALRDLGAALLLLLGPLGVSLLAEMEATQYDTAGSHILPEMLAGPAAPLFWFVLVGGVLVPFPLLWRFPRGGTRGIGVAALLVVAALLTERWNVVIPPLLGHAHLPYTHGGYSPGGPELLATLTAYAAALLAGPVLGKLFPVREAHDHAT